MHKKAETIFFSLRSSFPIRNYVFIQGGHICNYFIMISNYSGGMAATEDVGSFAVETTLDGWEFEFEN